MTTKSQKVVWVRIVLQNPLFFRIWRHRRLRSAWAILRAIPLAPRWWAKVREFQPRRMKFFKQTSTQYDDLDPSRNAANRKTFRDFKFFQRFLNGFPTPKPGNPPRVRSPISKVSISLRSPANFEKTIFKIFRIWTPIKSPKVRFSFYSHFQEKCFIFSQRSRTTLIQSALESTNSDASNGGSSKRTWEVEADLTTFEMVRLAKN